MYSKSTVHLAHLAQHIVFAATTANATGANFHSLFIQQPVDFHDSFLQYDLTGCLQVQIETAFAFCWGTVGTKILTLQSLIL